MALFGGVLREESDQSADPFLLRDKDIKTHLKNTGGCTVDLWPDETLRRGLWEKVWVSKVRILTPKLLVMWAMLEK